jgi:hypothetical protein
MRLQDLTNGYDFATAATFVFIFGVVPIATFLSIFVLKTPDDKPLIGIFATVIETVFNSIVGLLRAIRGVL